MWVCVGVICVRGLKCGIVHELAATFPAFPLSRCKLPHADERTPTYMSRLLQEENSNTKTLFYKVCSLSSVKNLSNN